MKELEKIALTSNQRQALNELRRRLLEEFEIENLVLFGEDKEVEEEE